jgi:hypothetical protein
MPKRFQIRRTKGWRKPENAVYVGRPTRWGNPYSIEEYGREEAMRRFRLLFEGHRDVEYPVERVTELRGKDLGCWCPPEKACHADILIEMANR